MEPSLNVAGVTSRGRGQFANIATGNLRAVARRTDRSQVVRAVGLETEPSCVWVRCRSGSTPPENHLPILCQERMHHGFVARHRPPIGLVD